MKAPIIVPSYLSLEVEMPESMRCGFGSHSSWKRAVKRLDQADEPKMEKTEMMNE